MSAFRPADLCSALLAALEAAEGRKRSRKRDQTPDTIGLSIKRSILERAIRDDPSPAEFAGWLLRCPIDCDTPGAVAAMARSVLDEWKLAHSLDGFRLWLERGAPSDDARGESRKDRSS